MTGNDYFTAMRTSATQLPKPVSWSTSEDDSIADEGSSAAVEGSGGDYMTTFFVYLMLAMCIAIMLFVLSQPVTEPLLIRLIFGKQLNGCNYTYVPSVANYRRPFKTYT